VNNPAVHLAVTISRTLPTYDLQLIAEAVRGGPGALQKLVANTAGIPLRTACTQILAAKLSGDDYHLVAGALLATMEPDPRKAAIDVVWAGPDAGVTTSRLTSAVVVELIEQARTDVLGGCLSQVQNGTSTSPTGLRSSSNGCGSVLTACCSNR